MLKVYLYRPMKPNWIVPGWLIELIGGLVNLVIWLGTAALDKTTGYPSAAKITALMTATVLSIGGLALLLAKAHWVYLNGGDIALEIGAITLPLCTLAGYSYNAKLKSEAPPPPEPKPE